jgi:molybdopterin-guanine dinucleotide biosynthesis protein B
MVHAAIIPANAVSRPPPGPTADIVRARRRVLWSRRIDAQQARGRMPNDNERTARTAPPVIIFVGHSGAGKTTLVERLLPELTRRGLRVATIKHAHHRVELDHAGKDSWRYTQAGAALSMLVTAGQLQLVAEAVDRRDPQQLAERFLGEADLVLAEGFSHAPGAKIEILRRACAKRPRCAIGDGLIALVTDVDEVYPQLPHFALDGIGAVADFVLAYAGIAASAGR